MSPVRRSDLSAWRMLAGLEDIHPTVIDNGQLMKWNSVEWIDHGPASDADKAQYPEVVEDGE
jgi:hypothetical protein